MSTPFCWEGGGGGQEKLTCVSPTSTSNFLGGPEGTGDVPQQQKQCQVHRDWNYITETTLIIHFPHICRALYLTGQKNFSESFSSG